MAAKSPAFRVVRFLAEHPLWSFVIAAVLILGTARAWQRLRPDEDSHASALTWAFLALMVAFVLSNLLLFRAAGPEMRVYVVWATALGPHVFGQVALTLGSPSFVLWVGAAASLVLAAIAAVYSGRQKLE